MSPEAETTEFSPGETIVLNALIDLFAADTIVLDEDSERHLREVVDEVTTPEDRAIVREEFDRLSTLDVGESADLIDDLLRFVQQVTGGLGERGYTVTVDHEYQQKVAPLDAHVYSYIHTGDTQRLRELGLSRTVRDLLEEARRSLRAGQSDHVGSKLASAVEEADGPLETVATRIIAGWGYFRIGDDERAMEFLKEALEREETSWAAQLVAVSIARDEADFIRSGKHSVGLLLRWAVSGTESTSTRAEVGGRIGDETVTWHEVEHVGGHAFVDTVYPENWFRFRLRGELPDFPSFQMYFLALGIYDNEMEYIESVIEQLGSGPHNEGSVERITLSQ